MRSMLAQHSRCNTACLHSTIDARLHCAVGRRQQAPAAPPAPLQALLARPFACTCPLVQRCLSNELMQLEEGAAATPSSPREKLTCQQRVLLLSPRSAVAADGAAAASARPLRAAMLHAGPGSQRRGAVAAAADSDRPRRYRRRLAPSCKELMYVSDGDANGVLYHLGTAYGSMSWVNPVASRAVRIVASSPASRFTDAKALASRQFLRTSFAGPRYVRAPLDAGSCSGSSPDNSSGDCCTWWLLDLGPANRLQCNFYTIRHDGSPDGFVRSWALQVSVCRRVCVCVCVRKGKGRERSKETVSSPAQGNRHQRCCNYCNYLLLLILLLLLRLLLLIVLLLLAAGGVLLHPTGLQ